MLASFGNETADDSSSSHEEDERDNVSPGILEELSVGGDKSVKSVAIAQPQPFSLHKKPDINHMLEQCKYNWFELVEQLHIRGELYDEDIILSKVSQLELNASSLQLIEMPCLEYHAAENDMYEQQHTA